MERQDVSDNEASVFFFQDLAESNGSTENQFQSKMMNIPAASSISIASGIGIQKIAIGRDSNGGNPREQEVKWVQVELCVFRLSNVDTDLLVTISKPIPTKDGLLATFSDTFQRATSTLQIRDWGLFG